MRCKGVRKKLMAYHDEEVSQGVREKISRHLMTCPSCSRALDVLKEGDRAAGMGSVPDPGPEYWASFNQRVMKKIQEGSGVYDRKEEPVRRGFSPVRLAPALSIALVVVVAAGVLMKVQQPELPVQPLHEVDQDLARSIPPSSEEEDLKSMSRIRQEEVPSPPIGAVLGEKREKSRAIDAEKRPPMDETVAYSPIKREIQAEPEPKTPSKEGDMAHEEKRPEKPALSATPLEPTPAIPPTLAEKSSPVAESEIAIQEKIPPPSDMSPDDGSWGQLAFANRLEEAGRHLESEKVLDDLLARNPAAPVQEQASLLLVSVLKNQNRLPEAREVLKDAQRQHPSNTMIQNYMLEEGD